MWRWAIAQCLGRSDPSDNLQRQNNQRGASRKCRSQKARSNDRRVPKMSAAQSDIQKRSHRMNRNRPDNRDEHKRNVKPLRWLAIAIPAIEQITANVDVQDQVAVEND